MSTATVAPPEQGNDVPATGSKARTIGIAVLVLALAAGAYWYFVMRPAGEEKPQPGEVVTLEPIQVNLSGGHYLRLGLALQLTDSAHELDGSKALDAAIGVFSGKPVGEVNKAETREELRHELDEELQERYHGDVMEVFFTEFVTQ